MSSFDNQHHWSKRDILNLLKRIKTNIPPDDFRTFQKTQADLNWEKIAFEHFSGKMCKLKWMEVSHNLRKFRTLTELVLEAKEVINQTHKAKPVKKHPKFPKRPLTAYMRFYKEERSKYHQMYPDCNNQQLTKILAEKYRQLPEETKERYRQDFWKEKQEFQEKLAQFKENHSDVEHCENPVAPRSHQTKVSEKKIQGYQKNEKCPPETKFPKAFSSEMKFQGEPKKPPMNGYHKFHRDSWSSTELHHLTYRERWIEISRRWHQVPESLRKHYDSQAEELQQQYWVEMDLWLKKLSPEEYAVYRQTKATCGKRKNLATSGGSSPKLRQTDLQSSSAKGQQVVAGELQELLVPGTDSSETTQDYDDDSQASGQHMMEDCKREDHSNSSYSSSTDSAKEDFSGNPQI